MRLMIAVSLLTVVFASPLCLAQRLSGPPTLENLTRDDAKPTQQPGADGGSEPAPWRPEGTIIRPDISVADEPDIDAAWDAYIGQVEAAAKAIEEIIEREVNGFAAEGNLDGATAWTAAGEQFKANGRIPKGLANRKPVPPPRGGKPEPTAEELVKKVEDRLADASGKLVGAYEAVEKALTTKHDFDKATKVREERQGVVSRWHAGYASQGDAPATERR